MAENYFKIACKGMKIPSKTFEDLRRASKSFRSNVTGIFVPNDLFVFVLILNENSKQCNQRLRHFFTSGTFKKALDDALLLEELYYFFLLLLLLPSSLYVSL